MTNEELIHGMPFVSGLASTRLLLPREANEVTKKLVRIERYLGTQLTDTPDHFLAVLAAAHIVSAAIPRLKIYTPPPQSHYLRAAGQLLISAL